MNLDISQWKPFRLSEIFYLFNGSGITKEEIECNPGSFPAIQSGADDNGCIGWIDKRYCIEKGYTYTDEPCLTVARTGTAGFVAFQPFGCVVGDSAKILLLQDVEYRRKEVYLFLRTLLMANQYKYTYGRKVTEDKYMTGIIMLPSKSADRPDWEYVINYIGSLKHTPISTSLTRSKGIALNTAEWKEFLLSLIHI